MGDLATVVNRHALPKTWPPSHVYVGRGTVYGNPFSVEEFGRRRAMVRYLAWMNHGTLSLAEMPAESPPSLLRIRTQLAGKTLVCSCTEWPSSNWRPCHAVVLARLANGEELDVIRTDVLERVGPEQGRLFSG